MKTRGERISQSAPKYFADDCPDILVDFLRRAIGVHDVRSWPDCSGKRFKTGIRPLLERAVFLVESIPPGRSGRAAPLCRLDGNIEDDVRVGNVLSQDRFADSPKSIREVRMLFTIYLETERRGIESVLYNVLARAEGGNDFRPHVLNARGPEEEEIRQRRTALVPFEEYLAYLFSTWRTARLVRENRRFAEMPQKHLGVRRLAASADAVDDDEPSSVHEWIIN